MDKYTGKRLDGRYEIGELIGVGGMAYVYHCYDTIDDREVSIKILKDEFLHNADFIRRFKNESKAIAVLSHPNIVKIYDVSFGDMIQYIVMEYIEGITLKEYIAQQGAIDWREAVHYVTQVLKALQHAHANGIVHRDIKPQNIMLLSDGSIKVTDFGIARFSDNATRTMTDQAIGSVHYIAPEQARGGVTDGKSDIYSVGVMLYEMLTGRLPFEAENAVSVAIMQLQSTPKRPCELNPAIPAGLEDITMKAMQKNTSARYQSAAEMLHDIEQFRMNPNIRFSYRHFVDNDPTKYVGPVKSGNRGADYDDDYSRNRSQNRRQDLDDKMFVDERPNKRRRSTVIIAGIVSALVVIGIIIGVFAVMNRFNEPEPQDVDVPNFIGKTLEEIENDNPENFKFTIINRYDETKQLGIVLEQDPRAGTKKVKEGSEITLIVNSKDEQVAVPDLSDYTQAEAEAELRKLNLIPEILEIESDDIEVGHVVRTNPPADTMVTVQSTVFVYVAQEQAAEQVRVPDVRNYTYDEAVAKLRERKLLAKSTYDTNSTLPRNTVISQNPLPESMVDEGYTVELVLSPGRPVEQEVPIYVDLPTEETSTVPLRVFVNGVLDADNSNDVAPSYNSSYTVTLKGTDKVHVIIELNGSRYREYDVDFSVTPPKINTTAEHPYTPSVQPTEPEPTQPVSDDESPAPEEE